MSSNSRRKSLVFAVDFDGTLCEHRFPHIGPEVPGALDTIKELQKNGHKVFLWTMRSGKTLGEAREWLEDRGVKLDAYNKSASGWDSGSPKAYANVYIDDAALGCPLVPDGEGSSGYHVDWKRVRAVLDRTGVIGSADLSN